MISALPATAACAFFLNSDGNDQDTPCNFYIVVVSFHTKLK
jgi:hypothetical protein